MKYLTIDYNWWGPIELLREEDGRMCCLGFACLGMGQEPWDIYRHVFPNPEQSDLIYEHYGLETTHQNNAADINDAFWDYDECGLYERAATALQHLRDEFREAGCQLRILNLPERYWR